jgi:hypothetical protein
MKHMTIVAALIAAFMPISSSNAFAQGATVDQRTYLTFSGPVQVPGHTLPAGTYLFRLADTGTRSIMQVYDQHERHLLGQFFFIPTAERTIQQADKANGKPVVHLRETVAGVPPAIGTMFYPTDLTGKEFLYPRQQAKALAAASHQAVLATDTEVKLGAVPAIVTIDPDAADR